MSTRTARAGGDALAVLHTAAAGDYVMVGATGRIYHHRPGATREISEISEINGHEHDTVQALLVTGLLRLDTACTVTDPGGTPRRGHHLVVTRHGRRALHEAAQARRADR